MIGDFYTYSSSKGNPLIPEREQKVVFLGRKVTLTERRGRIYLLIAAIFIGIAVSVALFHLLAPGDWVSALQPAAWPIFFTCMCIGVPFFIGGMCTLHVDGDPKFDWNRASSTGEYNGANYLEAYKNGYTSVVAYQAHKAGKSVLQYMQDREKLKQNVHEQGFGSVEIYEAKNAGYDSVIEYENDLKEANKLYLEIKEYKSLKKEAKKKEFSSVAEYLASEAGYTSVVDYLADLKQRKESGQQ